MATSLALVGALVCAALLVAGGAHLAERYSWCCLHGWALMHGMILVVFPAYFALSYLCLRPILRRVLPTEDPKTVHNGRRTAALAVCSLLLSGLGFLVPIVGAIPGLACGHAARGRFRAEPALRGHGLAIAGLVIGYAALLYSLYVFTMIAWAAFHAS